MSGAPTRKISDILRYNLELAKNSSCADEKQEEKEKSLNDASSRLNSSQGQGSMLPYRKATEQDLKLQDIKSSRSKQGSSRQEKKQLEQVNLPAINGTSKSKSRDSSNVTQISGSSSKKIAGEKEYTDEWPSVMNESMKASSELYQPTVEELGRGTKWPGSTDDILRTSSDLSTEDVNSRLTLCFYIDNRHKNLNLERKVNLSLW